MWQTKKRNETIEVKTNQKRKWDDWSEREWVFFKGEVLHRLKSIDRLKLIDCNWNYYGDEINYRTSLNYYGRLSMKMHTAPSMAIIHGESVIFRVSLSFFFFFFFPSIYLSTNNAISSPLIFVSNDFSSIDIFVSDLIRRRIENLNLGLEGNF